LQDASLVLSGRKRNGLRFSRERFSFARVVEPCGDFPMKMSMIGVLAAAVLLPALPVSAHHSFSMFDHDKTVALKGTVKEFDWTNPHAWLQVSVPDPSGKTYTWAFEMGGPAQEAKAGWAPTTVKPGDLVSVNFHPLKDGSHGGQLLNAVLADGKLVGRADDDRNPQPQ
jgi:hypothetical protein